MISPVQRTETDLLRLASFANQSPLAFRSLLEALIAQDVFYFSDKVDKDLSGIITTTSTDTAGSEQESILIFSSAELAESYKQICNYEDADALLICKIACIKLMQAIVESRENFNLTYIHNTWEDSIDIPLDVTQELCGFQIESKAELDLNQVEPVDLDRAQVLELAQVLRAFSEIKNAVMFSYTDHAGDVVLSLAVINTSASSKSTLWRCLSLFITSNDIECSHLSTFEFKPGQMAEYSELAEKALRSI